MSLSSRGGEAAHTKAKRELGSSGEKYVNGEFKDCELRPSLRSSRHLSEIEKALEMQVAMKLFWAVAIRLQTSLQIER